MATYSAIIVAAGSGKRFGADIPKQYLPIAGKKMLQYVLDTFLSSPVDEVFLVLPKEDCGNIHQLGINLELNGKKAVVLSGGAERYDSVWIGIQQATGEYCLIQDGARPFTSSDLLARCMETVQVNRAVVAAVPVTDTIKEVNNDFVVTHTPNRAYLWSIQTPQAFSTVLLKEAYQKLMKLAPEERKDITDDAMVVEMMTGQKVHIVQGELHNIKVTTPFDMEIAEIIATGK